MRYLLDLIAQATARQYMRRLRHRNSLAFAKSSEVLPLNQTM